MAALALLWGSGRNISPLSRAIKPPAAPESSAV